MHLTAPGGSQSPEGQTGAETYERGGLRTASFVVLAGATERRASRQVELWLPATAVVGVSVTISAGSKRPRWTQRPRPCPGDSRVREPTGGQTFNTNQGSTLWPPRLASGSCWRPASTSATRRAAGTPRCAASSSASAAGSTSSTCRRPSACSHSAQEFAGELAGRGGTILFVGTKKQARDSIKECGRRAAACRTSNQRWLGGLLTNFQTISQAHQAPARAARLDRGRHAGPAADRASASRAMAERDKLETNLGGVRRHAAPARRGVRGRPEDRGRSPCARPRASGSRSSGSSTRTATRTPWTS